LKVAGPKSGLHSGRRICCETFIFSGTNDGKMLSFWALGHIFIEIDGDV
jgi:hypothetical protein